MNLTSPTAQSSTPVPRPGVAVDALRAQDEEDFPIGCECANPALQIDAWDAEAAPQPLQQVY